MITLKILLLLVVIGAILLAKWAFKEDDIERLEKEEEEIRHKLEVKKREEKIKEMREHL